MAYKYLDAENGGRPIKMWADPNEVEAEAIAQLRNVASLPFVFKHVAVMPDCHVGKGATVGTVIATKNAVIPAAVGVDIGCGMVAVKTTLSLNPVKDRAQELFKEIESAIPLGIRGNPEGTGLFPFATSLAFWANWKNLHANVGGLHEKALQQMGSLGGGNHFIELCEDETGAMWVMIHSGSRHIGKVVADYHIHEAKHMMRAWHIKLPDDNLAYLPQECESYNHYLHDVLWCQQYARENRHEMLRRVISILHQRFGLFTTTLDVDCHHNYVAMEHHFGENVLITRKGAVRARQGDLGIIPGSMGTRSFIVRGLGNAESFNSCSHGAGRRMSRTQANKQYTPDDLAAQTEGVVCRKDSGVVDEIPASYKRIEDVMANQTDLVEVVATLKQFLCVKG